jgi:hypothetical protein
MHCTLTLWTRQREHATGTCSRLLAACAVFLAGLKVDGAGDSCRPVAAVSMLARAWREVADMQVDVVSWPLPQEILCFL